MLKYLLVFLASGFGGILRYWFGGLVQELWDRLGHAGATFPMGTLIVNISGCVAMGFLAAAFSGSLLIREEYRVAILVGVLGGYTTFSSFGRETMALVADGQWARAGTYVLLSVFLSLAGVWAGGVAAAKIYGNGAI